MQSVGQTKKDRKITTQYSIKKWKNWTQKIEKGKEDNIKFRKCN